MAPTSDISVAFPMIFPGGGFTIIPPSDWLSKLPPLLYAIEPIAGPFR